MATTTNKLPGADSITVLDEFRHTHDLVDFEEALVEVTELVFRHEDQVSVSLPRLPPRPVR